MGIGVELATFTVVFREALEASLVVGLIVMVLQRFRAHQYLSHVAISAMAAVLLSVAAGFWMTSATESAQGEVREVIEGSISLIAAAVLVWMFFWMERHARSIRSAIEVRIQRALSAKDYWPMMALPFVAVFREGVETVLFLKAVSVQHGGVVSVASGIAGCACALALVALMIFGGQKIPLKPVFRVTGIVVLLMAIGLASHGVHELRMG